MSIKKRSSNIELLRVAAMFMIVNYHIYCHCEYNQLTDRSLMEQWNNGYFNHPEFYRKLLLPSFMAPWGKIGDVIFILIAGYFMASKGKNIDLKKVSTKLVSQVLFAGTLLMAASAAAYMLVGNGVPLELTDITDFNSMSWFAGYYFVIILLAYLFFNEFLMKLNQQQYTALVAVLFAFTQLSWAFGLLNSIAGSLGMLATGLFVYALGGYIRRFDPFEKIRTFVFFLVIAGVYGLVLLSHYNITMRAISSYVRSGSEGVFIQWVIPWYGDNGFVAIFTGVAIFEIFRRMKLPYLPAVNYIGGAAFMIYLLHDSSFAYSIWATQDWMTPLWVSPLAYIRKHLVWSLATMAVGVAAYTVYLCMGKLLPKCRGLVIKKEPIEEKTPETV